MMRMMAARNPEHAPQHGPRYGKPTQDQHHDNHSETHTSLRRLCLSFILVTDSLVRAMLRKIDQWLIGMTVLFYRSPFTAYWRYTESTGGSMIGLQIGWQVARRSYNWS